MAGARPIQPGNEFFALNSDFSYLSLDPLGLRRPAQVEIYLDNLRRPMKFLA